MSAKGFLFDATTRNAVYVQRLAGGHYREVLKILDRMERDVLGIAAQSSTQAARQQQAVLSIRSAVSESMREVASYIESSAEETATYIAEFTQRMVSEAATADVLTPSPESVRRALASATMDVGDNVTQLTISQAVSQYGEAKSASISRALSDAVIGATKADSVAAVQQATGVAKRQAETLVRTSVNASAQVGRAATFAENDDILDGYEWVSVLDGNTTLICASLDGNIYQVGVGPTPPAHWGCRSQIVAALNPRYAKPELDGERRAENGDVTPNTTYGPWLKRQPADFQDEALGKTRAALFRRGDLPIDRFTDPTGKEYSIADLRRLEPQAFDKANL